MTVESVEFSYGSVQFVKEIKPTPAKSDTKGNVTINTVATPGQREHFIVTFMLTCTAEEGSSLRANIFHWSEVVTGLPRTASYGEVEAQAARQIAPNLRQAADAVERLVAKFDASVTP